MIERLNGFGTHRQREGIDRAKADGVYRGGKRRVCRDKVRAMDAAGHGAAAIAKALGCSRMQVYRIVEQAVPGGSAHVSRRSSATLLHVLRQ